MRGRSPRRCDGLNSHILETLIAGCRVTTATGVLHDGSGCRLMKTSRSRLELGLSSGSRGLSLRVAVGGLTNPLEYGTLLESSREV